MEAFKGAPWFKTIRGITPLVVGAGGTGSWMAFLLARAGVQTIVVMDDDIIEYRMPKEYWPEGDAYAPFDHIVVAKIIK